MLFRLASDTEDNDEALGKLLTFFSLCLLLALSFCRILCLGYLWCGKYQQLLRRGGLAARWRLVRVSEQMAPISSNTEFFHSLYLLGCTSR